jgi:hypothetical protein
MLDRPIEQSHDIIVGRARAIVEPYQPMHRPETDGALQSAPTARKLTRHREYQSSPRPARLVELGVSARQRKCSDKAVPVLLAEFALQPAMRVIDPTPRIQQNFHIRQRALRRIVKRHGSPSSLRPYAVKIHYCTIVELAAAEPPSLHVLPFKGELP